MNTAIAEPTTATTTPIARNHPVVAFPRAMPQLALDPRHAGHEAVRFDGAGHGAGGRVDLADLAVAVLADPQAALGPGQARV